MTLVMFCLELHSVYKLDEEALCSPLRLVLSLESGLFIYSSLSHIKAFISVYNLNIKCGI